MPGGILTCFHESSEGFVNQSHFVKSDLKAEFDVNHDWIEEEGVEKVGDQKKETDK